MSILYSADINGRFPLPEISSSYYFLSSNRSKTGWDYHEHKLIGQWHKKNFLKNKNFT